MQELVERALEQLRPSLDADGFELRLDGVGADGTVSVALEARPDACYDCLVPDATLLAILEQAIRKELPAAPRVVLKKINFGTE